MTPKPGNKLQYPEPKPSGPDVGLDQDNLTRLAGGFRQQVTANRGALALADQAILSGASFVTSLLIGRFLGKELLGVFFVTYSIFVVIQCVADQLLHTPYLVRAPKFSRNDLPNFTSSVLIHHFLLTFAACAALAITACCFMGGIDLALGTAFAALAIGLPGMLLRDFMHNFFHNRLRQWDAVALDFSVAAIQIPILILLWWTESISVTTALLAIGGSATLVALLWLKSFARNLAHPDQILKTFQSNWQIGKWALGSYLIGSSAPTILPWLLAALRGIEETGLLAACLTLVGIAQAFIRGVGKYMAPRMAGQLAESGVDALNRSILYFAGGTMLMMSVISVVIAIFGPNVLRIGFGADYEDTGTILLVLSITCWIQMLDVVVGNAILATGQTRLNFLADATRCLALLVPAFWLIKNHGAVGVTVCLAIGMLVGLVFRIALLRKTLASIDSAACSPPKEGA